MVHLPIRQILERSVDKLKRDTVRILDNDLGVKAAPPYTLYSFTSRLPPVENAQFLARGSDIDIGGYSTNNVTSVPYPSASSSSATSTTLPPPENSPPATPSWSHVAFHGNMSLRVPQEQAGRIRTGYAGIRNRKRMTLFGEDCWDLSSHTHLKVEVAYRGWEGWRNRWYCNIQTDGPVRTDLFQHRLDIPPSPASTPSPAELDPLSGPPPTFTTLHLPLSAFVLTNNGQTAERQIEMLYGKIRTVGFSLLGGGRGAEGVSSVNQTSPAQIAEFRRRAQAGYGKGGGKEDPDPVVEDMLKADGYGSKQVGAGGVRPGDPARASGYHRVPSVSAPAEGEVVDQEAADRQARAEQLSVRDDGTVKVTPWSEGYYELCVRSVQAVVFDPMADEEGPETRDM